MEENSVVAPSYMDNEISVEIEIQRYESSSLAIEITVVREENKETDTELVVALNEESVIYTEVTRPLYGTSLKATEVYSRAFSTMSADTIIHPRAIGNKSTKAEISVIDDGYSIIRTEIGIPLYGSDSIATEITPRVHFESSISTNIVAQLYRDSKIRSEVWVIDDGEHIVRTEIGVPLYGSIQENVEFIVAVNKDSDILTEITIEPNNKMTARYKLYAVGNLEAKTEIVPRLLNVSDINTEAFIRAYGQIEADVEFNVMYRGNSYIPTVIQPIIFNNMPTEIEVRPHNRMWAIYEVQQPKIVTSIANPVQDSFTRESDAHESINYGFASSMVAGISNDSIWRSFVQFDLSFINPSYVLTESYLRLYYKGSAPTHLDLEILNAKESWQEHNITSLNRPEPIRLISNEFTVNYENAYIEFDVLNIVKDWIALNIDNNGFIIRVSNETVAGQVIFNTRESFAPPELVVKYFDSQIFSNGRSQVITEIFAYIRGNSDINSEITVDSSYFELEMETELYVHRAEVPIPNDIETEITVNKLLTAVDLTVGIRRISETLAEVSVWENRINSIDLEITANRDLLFTEISSALWSENEIFTEISVLKKDYLTEISVPIYGDMIIDTEIEINEMWSSELLTELLVSKANLGSEITSRVLRKIDLYTVIDVSRFKLEAEIEVKYRSEIFIEITPNIKSDILTEITATRPEIVTEIGAWGYEHNPVDTEIDIKAVSQHEVEIYIKHREDLETEINIRAVSQHATEITVTKKKVFTELVIPTHVDHEILTVLQPRILMVNNIYTVVQVGSAGGAYAFII